MTSFLSFLRRAGAQLATPFAVLCLQLALSLFYWQPQLRALDLATPTWELCGVVALLVGLGWRRLPRRLELVVRAVVTAIVLAFLLLGFAERFARLEFGYSVALAIDIKYVPELFRMMFRADSPALAVFNCVVLAGSVALVVLTVYFAVARVHRAAGDAAARRPLVAGVTAFALLGGLILGMSGPLTGEVIEQIDLAVNRKQKVKRLAVKMEHEAGVARGNVGLVDAAYKPDILLFVVESYGGTLFTRDRFADFRTWLDEEVRGLDAAGYHMRSRFFKSPVFGGSSWMADSTLLCGVRVHNQRRHEALQQAAIHCLPELLDQAGYETVLAAGNTTFVDAPFWRLFPFARVILKDDLGYKGPRYAWSYVPDQYVIQRVDDTVLDQRGAHPKPLFAFYMLTSSHHPWSAVPPYFEQWDQIGDGSGFGLRAGLTFPGNQFVSGTQYDEGYEASIRYSLHAVFEYLEHLPESERPLVIVLGDHQPRDPVAKMREQAWIVPVHVLGRDPQAVERFAAQGYVPGVVPDGKQEPLGLERFVDRLIAALVMPPPAPTTAGSK
jgi:hypothetical protein